MFLEFVRNTELHTVGKVTSGGGDKRIERILKVREHDHTLSIN